MQILPMRLRR